MVYVWGSPQGRDLEPLYVGKAGLGVSQRLRQHEVGFRHSSAGRKNLERINALLGDGRQLLVYARKAGSATLLGIGKVNLYSAEEEAAAELFQPTWNRADFATSRQKAQVAGKAPMGTRATKPREAADLPSDDRSLSIGTVDFTGMLGGERLRGFQQGLETRDKTRLSQLLSWAVCLHDAKGAEIKLVGRYVNQPAGYNGVATLLVSRIGEKGRALPKAWVLRIPLRCDKAFPLTVTLPLATRAASVDEGAISRGKGECFRPLDLDAFLRDPGHYTTLARA